MTYSKNITNLLNLKVLFFILLCVIYMYYAVALYYHSSFSKHTFDKKPLKTLRTSKDKHKNMFMSTTGDSLSTDNRNFKVQHLGKIIAFFEVSKQRQTVSFSAHKYKPRKINTMFRSKSRIKRYPNEDVIETQTHDKMNQTKIIAPPTRQCYLCKSSADIVSSIGSLNLTHKYNDLNKFGESYCFENGIHPSLMIRNGSMGPGSIDLMIPEISIIPPYEKEGCFFSLYYNDEFLEDKFYVFRKGPALSKQKKWNIFRRQQSYNRDHYEIFYNVFNGSSIQYGQYSLHFAKGEVVRAYFYGEKPITVFKKQNIKDLQKSNNHSIRLTPEFEAFEDCIDHLKTANNSSYSQGRYLDKRGLVSNRTIGQKDYIKQLLQGAVQCQYIENYKRKSFPEYLQNVSLRPCPFCNWEYVPDDYDSTSWVFKLVLKQSHNPDRNKKMLLALTCTPTLCTKEKELDKKCKVTFAMPFIMKNSLYANHDNLNIYIVIVLMLIPLLIFASSTFYFLRRRKRMRDPFRIEEFPSNIPSDQVAEIEQYQCLVEGCSNPMCSHKILDTMKYLPTWVEPHMVFSEASIEKKLILGHGQYGTVHKGLFHNGNAVWNIAIKTCKLANQNNFLKEEGTESSVSNREYFDEVDLLLEEAKTMWRVGAYHENIINLQGMTVGVVNAMIQRVSLILEFCSHGNVREYLKEHSKDFKENITPKSKNKRNSVIEDIGDRSQHTLGLLIAWSYQVASGMAFLASKNIYHGDLAARNILLSDELVAKVSDFGLSKRIYQTIPSTSEEECGSMQGMKLPVKWLALEVLMHGNATIQSDVWSYGVLLWEIFELGEEPYRRGMDYRTLRDELLAGARLPNPTYSTPKISHLIQTCWLADPIERPTFTKIKRKLRESGNKGFDPDIDDTDYRYLKVLPSSAMRNQYKMIQESNPLYTAKENNDADDCTDMIEHVSSAGASPCESHPYLVASISAQTNITDLNSISTYQNSLLNYSNSRHKNTSLKNNEDCPLLTIIPTNNEDEMNDEVF